MVPLCLKEEIRSLKMSNKCKYKVGFSWPTEKGDREVVGMAEDGRCLVSRPGKVPGPFFNELLESEDIDFEIKWGQQEIKKAAAKKKAVKEEHALKITKEDTRGFADSFTPLRRAKVIAALNRKMFFDGVIMKRKEYIHKAIEDGAQVYGSGAKRRLEKPSGAFLAQQQLTKTGIDYAEYLIRKDD